MGLASLKGVMCVAFEADDSSTIEARTKLYSASDLAFVCKDAAMNEICIAQWEQLVRQRSEFESRCRCKLQSDAVHVF